ncbi:MAG: amylo-alpha-1,6-glucosidase [Actinomycetota bacterium]|nr:amylo-alpha-1,6-glucosidase [Actinomycetota bacterium]
MTRRAFEVRVGPPVVTIHADDQFMVCQPDGSMGPDRNDGYFVSDTRLVSRYCLTLSRTSPVLVNSSSTAPFSARFEFLNDAMTTAGGSVDQGTIHLRVDRAIGEGVHEDYGLTNYGEQAVELDLEIRIEGDFADLFDVKGGHLVRRGALRAAWEEESRALVTSYVNRDFHRGLRLQVENEDSAPLFANGTLSFKVSLAPRGHWHTCLLWMPVLGDASPTRPAHRRCHALLGDDARSDGEHRRWAEDVTGIETADPGVNAVVERAVDDLSALRISRHDGDASAGDGDGDEAWVPAAGIPWFVTLFGRDSLVVALQTVMLSPRLALGALRALAPLQGDSYDDAHDTQPGKIEHEVRHGELAHFHLVPQTPYYGAHDATALYVWAAAEVWRWTGDRSALDALRPNVERALSWIDTDGDIDGDGLQEYRTRAGDWGFYNQSWKDSGVAIVGADGCAASLPIATCELQGYVVAAKRGWADVAEQAFGDGDAARRLREQADRLAEAIEERFWWADEGTYYLGLDGDKRPIASVASNAGHLLWTGAVPEDRAAAVVRRLTAEDMWSGWGIRTLSAHHRSYNPFSYQRGSVWPHDNAVLAAGFMHYGHTEEAAQVARALFDAAERFQHSRLPEVFAGIDRDPGSSPAQYLGANVPQAWASGAIIHLVTSVSGLRPDADRRRLAVSPALPDWLGDVRLRGLRVGEASVDLRLSGNAVEIEARRGELRVEPK